MKPAIILASTSPRRRELLAQLKLDFDVCSPDIDERFNDTDISSYCVRMSNEKVYAGYALKSGVVIAADTCGEINNQLLGKPKDLDDAKYMLGILSNNEHKIHSSFAIYDGQKIITKLVTSTVRMRKITEKEIEDYWQTKEPCDKAGAYAIQGLGAIFIEKLSGSYSAVMGLPLFELASALQQFNVNCLTTK